MDSPKAGLMPLGERIQEALEAETRPAEQLRAARLGLLERVTSTRRWAPRATRRLRYAALAGGAALALAAVFGWSLRRPISFVAGAVQGGAGDVLEAAPHEPLPVEFSEGSRVLLRKGSRARVLETQATGARVLLENGVADVSIVHREDRATRWRFEAGPFQVLVTGTQFELGWQPEEQSLSLTMKEGTVELRGSCLPASRFVERGASLRLSCVKAPSQEPAVPARAQSAEPPRAVPPATGAPSAAHAPTGRDINTVAPSFEASCETADKAELLAAANRERLTGSAARARTALLVLRRRFPGSSESGTAAFMLGRLAFDQRAEYGEAARWFASYLAEQPNGALMGDAAGRLLEAYERGGNTAAARTEAASYLRRFPDGPYASRAKRVLAE